MKKEAPKSDAPERIAEKAGYQVIPARKEETLNTEEAARIEEKKRRRQSRPRHRSGVKQRQHLPLSCIKNMTKVGLKQQQ